MISVCLDLDPQGFHIGNAANCETSHKVFRDASGNSATERDQHHDDIIIRWFDAIRAGPRYVV